MAASPALPHLRILPVEQRELQKHYPPVVRTPLHTLQTGVGSRTVRREIMPMAGLALEILGHAIEYLADEYVLESGTLPSLHAQDPRVEAMQLLMEANRQVYYACPVMPSLADRLRRRFLRWAR